MKYLYLLAFAFLFTSCCSTKSVVDNASKEVVMVETNELPKQQNESPEVMTPNEDNSVVAIEIPPPPQPPVIDESLEDGVIDDYDPEAFLHYKLNSLLQKHVSEQGNVDYVGFKEDAKLLRIYIRSLGEHMPAKDWNDHDKLAYWINAYNAMTIDLIIRNYPVKSIKDIDNPWEQRLWKLGKKWYNLDEIEHQIIRKMGEPRIHFALVCAAKSCPKLLNKAFTAIELEGDLTRLTKEFLADSTKNTITENKIILSKLFKWFKRDFEQEGSLIDFLNQYSDVEISEKAKKSFKDYNWELNN